MLNKALRVAVFVVIAALVLAGVAFAHPSNGKTGKHATKTSVVKVKKAKKHKKSGFANVRGTILLAKASSTATKTIECSSCASAIPSVTITATVVGTSTTETTIALAHAHLRLIVAEGKKRGRTAYAAQTNKCGKFAIKHVRKGLYTLKIWAKDVKPTCFTVKITDTGAVCAVGPCPIKKAKAKPCPKAAS